MARTYAEKLLDPRWQKMRLYVLERDGWKCTECGNSEDTLHVHHRVYYRGLSPWEYDARDLVSVCAECHEKYEEVRQELSELIFSRSSLLQLEDIRDHLQATSNPDEAAKYLIEILNVVMFGESANA